MAAPSPHHGRLERQNFTPRHATTGTAWLPGHEPPTEPIQGKERTNKRKGSDEARQLSSSRNATSTSNAGQHRTATAASASGTAVQLPRSNPSQNNARAVRTKREEGKEDDAFTSPWVAGAPQCRSRGRRAGGAVPSRGAARARGTRERREGAGRESSRTNWWRTGAVASGCVREGRR